MSITAIKIGLNIQPLPMHNVFWKKLVYFCKKLLRYSFSLIPIIKTVVQNHSKDFDLLSFSYNVVGVQVYYIQSRSHEPQVHYGSFPPPSYASLYTINHCWVFCHYKFWIIWYIMTQLDTLSLLNMSLKALSILCLKS